MANVEIEKMCLDYFKDGEEKEVFPYYNVEVNYSFGPEDSVFFVMRLRRAGNSIAVSFASFLGARQFELDMCMMTRISCENILSFLKSQPELS